MKVKKIEYHKVDCHFTYDIPEEDIIETFGSTDRFKEIVSHLGSEWNTKMGAPPTDEEYDKFMEFIIDYDYDDREDDWVSDRKGYTDVEYEILEEE